MAFRTQKISQMTPKGADLEATDLIEVSTIESGSYVTRSITGQELIDAIPPTTIEWGDIGGTLSNQTDLNTALNGKVPTTRTLTINGTTQDLSANRTFTIPTDLTVGTTPIASGTIGRVLFQGTGNVLQQSSSLFWDSTNNRLGIGTSSPLSTFEVVAGSDANGIKLRGRSADNISNFFFASNDGVTQYGYLQHRSTVMRLVNNVGDLELWNGPNIGSTVQRATLFGATGNLAINTTTDAGFRLDVNGTARVQGNATIVGTSLSSFSVSNGATAMIQTASSGIGSSDFRLRLFNNGNTQTLDLYGSGDYDHQSKHAFRTNGTERMRIFSTGNVLINTTTDAGFRLDVNGTARVQGNLTLTSAFQVKFANNNRWIGPSELYAGVQIYAAASGSDVIQMTAGQQVHISSAGGITTQTSSVLQVDSTTKGFLPPRQTQAQRTAIASPAVGLIVYQTDLAEGLYIYKSTGWTFVI